MWITGQNEPYENQLRLLNILPLPMYMQMNDLLTILKLTQEWGDDIEIPELNKVRDRSTELYTLRKVRLEKARNEFVLKNCRLANWINDEINLMEPRGLKNRILYLTPRMSKPTLKFRGTLRTKETTDWAILESCRCYLRRTNSCSWLRATARTAGKRGQFSKLKLGINSPQFLTVKPQQQQHS